MDNPTSIAIISAGGALLGAALGALGGFFASRAQAQAAIHASERQATTAQTAAREQIQATTIVASRQRWIDELRAELARMVGMLLQLQMSLEERTPDNRAVWLRECVNASALEGKIALMLNPNEPEHQALMNAVRAALNEIRMGRTIDWGERATAITHAGQLVLKEAWDRIKAEAALGRSTSLPDLALRRQRSNLAAVEP